MTFANPYALLALLLLPVFGWLYLRRAGKREVVVPGVELWRDAVELSGAEAGKQSDSFSVQLFLAMLAIAAMVLAAAQPAMKGTVSAPENILVVVDCSMSMTGQAEIIPNREVSAGNIRATEILDKRIELLDKAKPKKVSVVTLPLSGESVFLDLDLSEAYKKLAAIKGTALEVDIVAELSKISGLAARASAILVVTDNPSRVPREIAGRPVTVISGGEESKNVAIETFEVNRGEKGVVAFALIKNHGKKTASVPLALFVDENEKEKKQIQIDAGGTEQFTSAPFANAGKIQINITDDDLALDNQAVAIRSAVSQVSVAYIGSGNPFVFRALELLPNVDVKRYKLSGDVAGEHALYIYDGVAPEKLPAGNVVLVNPPRSVGAVRMAGVVSNPDGIRASIAKESPLLADIADVTFKRVLQMDLGENAEVLATSEDGQGIVAARVKDGDTNILVIGSGLDLAETNWPLHPSFPVFWAELVNEISAGASDALTWYNTGDLVPLAGADSQVVDPFGNPVKTFERNGRAYFIPAWPGIYTAGDVKYAVNAIHPSESANDGVTEVPAEIKTVESTAMHKPLWRWFAAAGLLLAFAFWATVRIKGE